MVLCNCQIGSDAWYFFFELPGSGDEGLSRGMTLLEEAVENKFTKHLCEMAYAYVVTRIYISTICACTHIAHS